MTAILRKIILFKLKDGANTKLCGRNWKLRRSMHALKYYIEKYKSIISY